VVLRSSLRIAKVKEDEVSRFSAYLPWALLAMNMPPYGNHPWEANLCRTSQHHDVGRHFTSSGRSTGPRSQASPLHCQRNFEHEPLATY
ncbi:MAG: hypothetical protein ACLVB5_06515, partial [Christensenellales bacterium]